jgi:hypothetical protein
LETVEGILEAPAETLAAAYEVNYFEPIP